jgi:prevent-host-death family protein
LPSGCSATPWAPASNRLAPPKQEVAREAARAYIERASRRELLDEVLDEDLPRLHRAALALRAAPQRPRLVVAQAQGHGHLPHGTSGDTSTAPLCITRDTVLRVADVTIRQLRNHGGEVVDRAARGEQITITRAGKAVAELTAVPPQPLRAQTLLDRWRRLPPMDPARLRADLDAVLDASV